MENNIGGFTSWCHHSRGALENNLALSAVDLMKHFSAFSKGSSIERQKKDTQCFQMLFDVSQSHYSK